MWEEDKYVLFKSTKQMMTSDDPYLALGIPVRQYPIVLLEDGMGENDWNGWRELTVALGSSIELVGDDIFCTNPRILSQGIEQKIANSIPASLQPNRVSRSRNSRHHSPW